MSTRTPDNPAPASPHSGRARWAALAAFVVVIAAVLVVVLGGGTSHYTLLFQNAGQLVPGDQVQIGGVPQGTIDSISLTSDNQAKVDITVEAPFAPLHRGTTAEIRGASLSGVANRFIALHPGPNSAPLLADGAVLGTQDTAEIVDIDQLFNTFDPRTRRALREVVQGSATQYADVAPELQRSAHYFSPALSTTSQLLGKLTQDRPAFRQFLKATGDTMATLARTSPQIDELVANGATTFSATASQQQALRDAIAQAPSTLAAGDAAMTQLGETLPSLTKLVDATKPVTPGLQPFLADLQHFLDTSKAPLGDLASALDPSSPGVVTATDRLPGLQDLMGPATKHSAQALQRIGPMFAFARPYAPDLTAALTGLGQAGGNYDADGNYVRGVADFNNYAFDGGDPGTLTPNPPTQPLAGVQTGKTARCPGGATQPTADGSAPYVPEPGSCDPKQVPPR